MVEVKQVGLAEQVIRAIARQAEAERERRAKIIHADGEYTAAESSAWQRKSYSANPGPFSCCICRHWSRWNGKEPTIVFPLPVDIISSRARVLGQPAGPSESGKLVVPHAVAA